MKIDMDHWRQWIGRKESADDGITVETVRRFRSLFDSDAGQARLGKPALGDAAPLAIHWCLAPAIAPMSELGADGHPARGGFLPPVPLPRRMWAGCETRFFDVLRIGDAVEKQSVILDISLKEGRSGVLCFVKVEHSYITERGLALSEIHDIVYRDAVPAGAPASVASSNTAPLQTAETSRAIAASETLLFRYSAVTFNTHRIHYDQPYATGVEGYPGLVVHGPLQATVLLQAVSAAGGSCPQFFSHRGLAPLYTGGEFTVNTARVSPNEITGWTQSSTGQIAMVATARW